MKATTVMTDVLKKVDWLNSDDGYYPRPVQLCSPTCEICGGGGWVRFDLPREHPQFGKLQPCPNMDIDVDLPGKARLYGLSKHERALDWTAVLPLEGSNAVEAVDIVRRVIERGYGWVYLWGDYGVAKSLILQIATAVSLRSGKDASYIRMAEILDHLRDGFDEGDYSSRMEWWLSVPILCIDEFERVNETGWAENRRFVLMDNRYVNAGRRESVTIMAGNKNPSTFDGYLWDRIQDGRFHVVKVTGESARPGMEWES